MPVPSSPASRCSSNKPNYSFVSHRYNYPSLRSGISPLTSTCNHGDHINRGFTISAPNVNPVYILSGTKIHYFLTFRFEDSTALKPYKTNVLGTIRVVSTNTIHAQGWNTWRTDASNFIFYITLLCVYGKGNFFLKIQNIYQGNSNGEVTR